MRLIISGLSYGLTGGKTGGSFRIKRTKNPTKYFEYVFWGFFRDSPTWSPLEGEGHTHTHTRH